MRIRTQFIITTSIFAMMLIVVAASVLITNQQVQRLDAQEEIARRIERGTTELTYLAGDYLLHGESQQRARWESRFASFSADLSSLAPGNAEQQALVSNIKANAQRLRGVFTEVASTIDGAVQGQDQLNAAFVQVSWSRMAVQNQGISFDASRLSRLLNRQASQTKQTNIMLVLALMVVFAAYFVVNYFLMFHRTLKSIAELQAGTKTIGSGNLDFTIAEKRADEIGDLSRAFNRMTANLKSVTASKSDLEKEIAERKQAEEALKQSEGKYRSLFTSMSTGYAYCKIEVDEKNTPVDFTYVEVNDAFERLTGLSKASVTGKKVTQAIPGIREMNPEIITTYGKVALTGEPTAFEVFFGPLQIWLTISVYSPGTGYFVALFDNITERKRAEEKLQASEEKYRSLFDNMTEAFGLGEIILDGSGKPRDFRFLEVNRAWEEMVRIPRAKAAGNTYREVVPAASQHWIDTYARVALTGEPTTFEYHYRLTGSWFQAYVFSPRKGQFAYVFADVTERKRAEEQATRQKAIQEAINRVLEATMACATEEDLGRACLTIAEQLTESKFGFIGKVGHPGRLDDIAISDPGWQACRIETPVGHGRLPRGFTIHGIYGRVLLDGKAFFTNNPASHPDRIGLPEGHPPLTSFLGIPLISEGTTTGMLALGNREGGYRPEDQEAAEALAPAIVEALERKRAEEEIKGLVEELTRRAAALEASNRELESFSYSVSHDLRAPLRSMDGFSMALLEDYADKLDEEGKDWLRRIRASSQLMAQLIDDILGLSRVVRAEIQLQEVNLSDTASAIAEGLKSTQPERRVEFDVMPNMEVRGDANLLRLALENLLGNAFKFTARRQTARIEFGATEQDGQRVYFVRDNGAGFDMQYAEKLFRPFQRLHSEKEFTGTGIGLATVQRIIRRHGGKVWAEAEPGKGATFYFTLAQGSK